jgi:hypothetical protein
MVSYQAWVSICFETLQDQGVEVSDLEDGAEIMEFCSSTWRSRSGLIKRMTTEQAGNFAVQLARSY